MSKEIIAIDIDIETPLKSEGTAYYRLTKEMRDFLNLCEEKHGIAGFKWDAGSMYFGVILKYPREAGHKESKEKEQVR